MRQVTADWIPSGLITVDPNGRIVDANALVFEWTGRSRDELIASEVRNILQPPDSKENSTVEFLPAIAEIVHREGRRRPVLVATSELVADGNQYLTLFEATAQREFRERLQHRHLLTERTQNRLQLVIDASIAFSETDSEDELAAVLAATTARAYAAEEAVVFLLDENRNFKQVAGTNPFVNLGDVANLTAQALGLRSVLKIAGVDQAFAMSSAVGHAFENAGVRSMIIAPIHRADEPFGILAAFFHHPRQFDEQASPLADALAGLAARAVSALRLQNQLEHAAMHDETTGLPNRRLLDERLEMSHGSSTTLTAVLFVDLDGFKGVNDRLGHQVGDEILREVAARLRSTVRGKDIVARYGGDEFVIVCDVTTERDAVEMAERVLEQIRMPYSFVPDGFSIGASIGVSITPAVSAASGVDSLVREADQAMYRAKGAGGDRIVAGGV